VLVLAAGVAGTAAGPASASAIPGATYTGVPASGGAITLTVAADGTRVSSYRIDVQGDTCTFVAEGDDGVWEGAAIVQDAFEYHLYESIALRGTFSGEQSVTGTFRLYNYAVGSKPACDTGTVAWSASTSATPPPPGSSPPAGSPPAGSAGSSSRRFATGLLLRRRSRTTLGGRVTSASATCRARRRVLLVQGSRTIASTTSASDGRYSFRRSARTRGRRVRALATARGLAGAMCAAGSSKAIPA
jgi:hypothetical protein